MDEHREYKIQARNNRFWIDFREVFDFREVLYLLVWRDLKVRYKQTLLGLFWAVLQPILATVIFTIIFTRFARFESGEVPYSLFALSGFTMWMFINSTVNLASISLVYHEQLVTKIYFPRMIVPAAPVGAGILDLLLSIIILIAFAAYVGFLPSVRLLLLPLFILYAVVVALSVSLILSALNVRFRDVKFLLYFILQIWMFASPVFYPSEWIPGSLRLLFALNPVTGLLDGFRYVMFGTELNASTFAVSVGVTILVCVASLVIFHGLEDDFADLL